MAATTLDTKCPARAATRAGLTNNLSGRRFAVGERTCTIDGCQAKHYGHGMCARHWQRWYSTGDPLEVVKAPPHSRPVCEVDDCERKTIAQGLCTLHYQRARKGQPLEEPTRYERGISLYERLTRYIAEDLDTGCWLWQGATDRDGYGCLRIEGRALGAHRVAYTVFWRPIPPGLFLDHLCDVKPCVNPAHLEPVTNAENVRRGYERRGGAGHVAD